MPRTKPGFARQVLDAMAQDEPMSVGAVLDAIDRLGYEVVRKRPRKHAPPFSSTRRDKARR